MGYLAKVQSPLSVTTAIENGLTFPEKLDFALVKYAPAIELFGVLATLSTSSQELLGRIRVSDPREVLFENQNNVAALRDALADQKPSAIRMSLLKIFRRCVCPVCDTEATKKINKIKTEEFIENYGQSFKPIEKIREQFSNMSSEVKASLAMLIGEYDDRGQQGYELTERFFDWFDKTFAGLTIEGPRRAGRDIELSAIFEEFEGRCPCDFIIKQKDTVLAIGFARYDSTRGGAQSDDRTGGNLDKLTKIRDYSEKSQSKLKIIFLADGPGLAHNDTWEEACSLDGQWNDNVRVITLKIAAIRLTKDWLLS